MCRAAIITGGPEFGEFSPTIKKLQRRVHNASYVLDVLSTGSVEDEIVGLEESEHDKKKESKKRSSAADGTDAPKNAKLPKRK
jgi:hypothetical protein